MKRSIHLEYVAAGTAFPFPAKQYKYLYILFELVNINAYFTTKLHNDDLQLNYLLMTLIPVDDFEVDKLWFQTLGLISYSPV